MWRIICSSHIQETLQKCNNTNYWVFVCVSIGGGAVIPTSCSYSNTYIILDHIINCKFVLKFIISKVPLANKYWLSSDKKQKLQSIWLGWWKRRWKCLFAVACEKQRKACSICNEYLWKWISLILSTKINYLHFVWNSWNWDSLRNHSLLQSFRCRQ